MKIDITPEMIKKSLDQKNIDITQLTTDEFNKVVEAIGMTSEQRAELVSKKLEALEITRSEFVVKSTEKLNTHSNESVLIDALIFQTQFNADLVQVLSEVMASIARLSLEVTVLKETDDITRSNDEKD